MAKTNKGGGPRESLVAHFRAEAEAFCRLWVRQLRTTGVVQNLIRHGLENESRALYAAFVDGLEPRNHKGASACARSIAQRASEAGIPPDRLVDSLLALQDVHRRSLIKKHRGDAEGLAKALDVYSSAANRLVVLVIRDVFEAKEAAATREVEQLRTLVKTGMILSAKLSLEAVLQRIANMACKVVGARYGALGVLDGKGGLSQFITAGIDEKTKRAIGPLPVGKGILGVLVHEAKPLRLRNLTMDPRAHGFPPNHPPMKSFLGVPIASKGKVFGNLYLTEKRGTEEFSEDDADLAKTLAAQAAIAIENASLYGELDRWYKELKRSQAMLLRQEKLASLGRLAAGLAHELNNPLNHIAGFVEALQRRAEAETLLASKGFEDFPRFLGMIQGLDLGRLISESVAFVERQAAVANKRIVVRALPEPVPLRADAQMLQQLFLNLLTNALDAIEGDGEVRVTANVVEAGHGARARREIVEISVADNGGGIAAENLPKVFDPFFTTKEVGKGTGLGLPICQSIVEQHGGTIEIKSDGIGKGTLVTVKLPVQR
ncbi:MAG: GAF domain-containing protein [Candidatus Rokubacteria bacterium]|nr:GAF domain-containing protein [Candidatus Rokubacteria bacterium]